MHKFLSLWAVDGLKSSYFPANKCYNMLAEMLHCSFSPVEDKKFFFFSENSVKLLSCSALQTALKLVIGTRWRIQCCCQERCHLECVNQEFFSLPKKCVSAMLSQEEKEKKKKKKGSVRQLSKVWSEFREAALVTMWGADHVIFFNSWLTSGLSCHPKDLL